MKNYDKNIVMDFIQNNDLKTAEDVNSKFKEMYKDVIEVMLQNDMDNHLGYSKYDRKSKKNNSSRNGSSSKNAKSTFGELSTLFAYTKEIRRIMYTTNIVKSLHRQYRKITKTKNSIPNRQESVKNTVSCYY